MAKKIKPSEAEIIIEDFRKMCYKLTKVSPEGCDFNDKCDCGLCIVKYVLKKFNVYEKE